jgi:tRNA-uridine 2-sulfurtransferase
MKRKTVLLAMSGGVDSSVAAYMLQKKGFTVIGLTFKFWGDAACGKHNGKNCCSTDAINDAKGVCAELNIPHYVIDYADEFQRIVMDAFVANYKKNLTPNPCIVCNTKVKFPILLKKLKQFDADYIATGHHAICRYSRMAKKFCIGQGKDKNKDQSYVLFGLNQEILSRLILPVGNYTKDSIRSIAKRLDLKSYYRQESQEICFIPNDDLVGFLKDNLGDDIKKGYIKDKWGKILNKHNGTCFYTIGQRRGLGIPYKKPIYVTDICMDTGQITVGEYSDTYKKRIFVNNVNWVIPLKDRGMQDIYVKIRYNHKKVKAAIRPVEDNITEIVFRKPQHAPTPGQAAVFYKGSIVVGGGWIIHK